MVVVNSSRTSTNKALQGHFRSCFPGFRIGEPSIRKVEQGAESAGPGGGSSVIRHPVMPRLPRAPSSCPHLVSAASAAVDFEKGSPAHPGSSAATAATARRSRRPASRCTRITTRISPPTPASAAGPRQAGAEPGDADDHGDAIPTSGCRRASRRSARTEIATLRDLDPSRAPPGPTTAGGRRSTGPT